ncbi:MAG TPA: hypothetical protein VN934_05115 [Candidatus Tumulicola sp.]|nr:hypothetical protein [Candidatus Tumulicola sp.]
MQNADSVRAGVLNLVCATLSVVLAAVALIQSLFEGLLGAVRDELAAIHPRGQ